MSLSAGSAREQPIVPARIERILVPLDGSKLAETVLPAAYTLAERCRASITLLHVIEHHAPDQVHGQRHLNDVTESETYLAEVEERYQRYEVPASWHVHPNPEHDVARSIGQHADELGADLIALATHGTGGLKGFIFGRIAQQVLGHTTTPVLLAQPRDAESESSFRCRLVLVPLDGTEDAEAALPMARLLAERTAAELRLVRVVETVETISGQRGAAATFSPTATAALLDVEENQARDELAAIATERLSGLAVTTEVRRGDIPDELARATGASGADLICLSTHGRAGISGRFAGSIADRLLSHVDVPLLLVRI